MKEKFFKSVIVLVIGGLLIKVLGMVIRIVIARTIGEEGMGLYMMISPTFNLFITIATLSLTTAISKLVSDNNKNNKNIVLGIIPVVLIFNVVLIIVLSLLSPLIANFLLKNSILYLPIFACTLTLPFICISSVIRGYFFGKENMIPNVISNLIEQITRICMIVFFTPLFIKHGIIYAVTSLVLFNIVSESISIFILFMFLPKKVKIRKSDLLISKENFNSIMDISLPTTFGRIVSSIGIFLEPIIITYVLLYMKTPRLLITLEYGIITGYVLPMIMMPSFLSGAVGSALLPIVAKSYTNKKYKYTKQKIMFAIFLSFAIGFFASLFLFLFPKFSLSLIFSSTKGVNYLKVGSILYLISYIFGPLISSLQAMNLSGYVMKYNTIGIVIKIISLTILLFLDFGMYSILISSFIYFVFVSYFYLRKIFKVLK